MPPKSKKGQAKKDQKDGEDERMSFLLKGPQVYAIGAFGDWTAYDFRINFYADVSRHPDNQNEKVYIVGTQVILTPRAMKELAKWLTEKVDQYEQKNGVIETIAGLKSEDD